MDTNKKETFKVLGLRIEKYVAMECYDEDEYEPVETSRAILCLMTGCLKYELTLDSSSGMCPSGWTTASWGESKFEYVSNFKTLTHLPIRPLSVELELDYEHNCLFTSDEEEEIENEVFSFSETGGDMWYPRGGYHVNMELFKETGRAMSKRPVWVFYGASGKGKSSIAFSLDSSKSVYETDSEDTLPEEITADVVVIGNRHGYTVEDIKPLLFGDPEIILVHFE